MLNMNNNNVLYEVKSAKITAEIHSLINAGFEYVCDCDGTKVFRKWRIVFMRCCSGGGSIKC